MPTPSPCSRRRPLPPRLADTVTSIPFDYAATARLHDWRQTLTWPIEVETLRSTALAPAGRLLDLAGTLDPTERDILLLAGPHFLAAVRYGVEVAMTLAAADRQGMDLRSEDPLVSLLRGDAGADPRIAGTDAEKLTLPRHPSLRRLLRTASWTPVPRLLRALLSPDAVALTHNHLLTREARRRGAAVRFHQGEAILLAARQAIGGTAPAEAHAIDPRRVISALKIDDIVDTPYRAPLTGFLERFIGEVLETAARDLAGLRALRRLPGKVWSGTGGKWSSRAIGLAVRERGGGATRFDHGGTSVVSADPVHVTLTELSVSSTFVLPTPAAAERVSRKLSGTALPGLACSLEAAGGDPTFDRAPDAQSSVSGRVLYVPGVLRGARQFHGALLPDPIYLDWQLRVAETLRAAGTNILCKPHPHGLLRGQTHPLAAVAPTSSRLFEEEIAETDVFLFDFPQSTTFWSALCTERPVVLLDFGLLPLAVDVAEALARRATVVRVDFDGRNLPVVPTSLPALLRDVAGQRHDPGYFRTLLAGT